MKKNIILFSICIICFTQAYSQESIFQELLKRNVSNDGIIDYKSFKNEEEQLNKYLLYLENTDPDINWSKNKQKAFWVNAYNAYTIKLILKYYPLKSITDITLEDKNAWKIPFAKIGGKNFTLDFIEHEILRKKFFDPKIHVGVNCASLSCPKLANFIFTEENVNEKLSLLMKMFINDSTRNKISSNEIQISEIFKWFREDFTKNNSLIQYLNKYSDIEIEPNAKISYLPYNWSLNGK